MGCFAAKMQGGGHVLGAPRALQPPSGSVGSAPPPPPEPLPRPSPGPPRGTSRSGAHGPHVPTVLTVHVTNKEPELHT